MQTIDVLHVIQNADKHNIPNVFVAQLLGLSESKVKLLQKSSPENIEKILSTHTIYDLEQLKDILLNFIKNTQITTLILAGSYARGTATADSDIDIIIDSNDIVEDYEKMDSELCALLGKRIDIVTVTGIENSVYRDSLLEGSILIYGKGL